MLRLLDKGQVFNGSINYVLYFREQLHGFHLHTIRKKRRVTLATMSVIVHVASWTVVRNN